MCKFLQFLAVHSLFRSFPDRLLPRMPYIPDHTAFHGFLTASGPDKTDHRPRHPPPEGGQGQQTPGSGQRLYRQNDGFDRFCTAKHSGFLRFPAAPGSIQDSFPYLSICFSFPSASPSIQNPSAFPLIRTSSIATARRWYA